MSKVDLSNTTEKQPQEVLEPEKSQTLTKKRVQQLTFLVTISLAAFVCYLSMLRYFSWMVQTVIDRTDVHISEIPFPAITLCPIVNIHNILRRTPLDDQPLVREFLRQMDEYIEDDDNTSDFDSQARIALELVYGEKMWGSMTYRCQDFFAECTWRRIKWNCCSLFRPRKYGMSLCYSFNSLTVDNSNPTWPWSETLSGRNSGLSVTMMTNASKAMQPKVMAMIHYPEEAYSSDTSYIGGEVHISLDAAKFYADTELRELSPESRRCYFLDEIHNSNSICLKDCRVAYLEKVCNCKPHSPLDIIIPHKDKQYCNATHLACIYEHRDAFYSTGNIYVRNLSEESTEVMDCKCYPNCNYVQYKPFHRYSTESSCSNTTRDKNLINLNVSYLRNTIFSYRSAMVYCLLDLLVAICSIIALFLGISFISVIKAIQDHFERRRRARALGRVAANQ